LEIVLELVGFMEIGAKYIYILLFVLFYLNEFILVLL
jgi:hypothetical protein